ncbi:hypothetical protein GGI02_005341, partial [Coemansia sp. RSA 2322]
FPNVTSIAVDIDSGFVSEYPDNSVCAANVSNFVETMEALFPNATLVKFERTNIIEQTAE